MFLLNFQKNLLPIIFAWKSNCEIDIRKVSSKPYSHIVFSFDFRIYWTLFHHYFVQLEIFCLISIMVIMGENNITFLFPSQPGKSASDIARGYYSTKTNKQQMGNSFTTNRIFTNVIKYISIVWKKRFSRLITLLMIELSSKIWSIHNRFTSFVKTFLQFLSIKTWYQTEKKITHQLKIFGVDDAVQVFLLSYSFGDERPLFSKVINFIKVKMKRILLNQKTQHSQKSSSAWIV